MQHLYQTPPSEDLTKEILATPWVALDTEYGGEEVLPNPSQKKGKKNRPHPNQFEATVVGFSLWYPGCPWPEGAYFPVVDPPFPGCSTGCSNWCWLRSFLAEYEGQIWFHNALADLTVTTNTTNNLPFPLHPCDSMVLGWALGKYQPLGKNGSILRALSLDSCIRRDLGVEVGKSFNDLAQGRSVFEIPAEEMAPYAARDAWYTGRLVELWLPEVQRKPELRDYVFDVEFPLLRAVSQMYTTGIPLDSELLLKSIRQLEIQEEETRKEFLDLTTIWLDLPTKVKEETGEFFKNGKPKMKTVEVMEPQLSGASITSGEQIGRWLVDEMKLWPAAHMSKTKEGKWAVGKEHLEQLVSLPDPLASRAAVLRLQHSKLSKLRGTYLSPLPLHAQKYNTGGRVHPQLVQHGTETSRFSSNSPNIQNLPRNASEQYYGLTLPSVRDAFVAPGGYVFLCADYSQIELRVMAHLSQDEAMMRAFNEDLDPHRMTQDKVKSEFGMTIDRTLAKITNFSTIYRISAKALSSKLGLPQDDAKKIIQAFYATYPKVRDYQKKAVAYARKHREIPTLGGYVRKLNYPEGSCSKANSSQRWCSCDWCRQASQEDNKAINTPVQGTAGVIMKKAMVDLERTWRGTDNRILSQVHDELLCMVPDDDNVEKAKAQLSHCMENAMKLRVPLKAEAGCGRSWTAAKG